VENDWIETKRAANLEKHGIDFADLDPVFESRMLVTIDRRRNYGEERKVGFGMLDGRVIVVVWAEHRDVRWSSQPGEQMKKSATRTTRPAARGAAPGGKGRTNFARLDAMTDEDVARQVEENPDAAPLFTDEMLAELQVVEPKRVPISLKVEPDVLAFFKSAGPGYQTRMQKVLRAYMEQSRRKAGK
jgi:uncharacterized DUF497 family protein/uncharacterized protein (DUF4415 family)